MKGRVGNKLALVTGGASGLGEAMCRLLGAEGARVIVADIDQQCGEALVESLCDEGIEAAFLELDVASEAAWDRAIETIESRFGALHILVNNAGIAPEGPIEMDFSLWRRAISINLDGAFLGTRAAIRTMRKHGERGSIINISSIMGMTATPNTAAYSASKGGVRSLTKAAALYCGSKGLAIRVNSVHPGMCVTPLVESYFASHPGAREEHVNSYPIGHLGEAMDIAQGVLYLASDESKFMLGTELVIDGGYLAQ